MSKEEYLNNSFIECCIDVAKEYTQSLKNIMQGKRKQYWLKPYVKSIINGAIGDTLQYMSTQVSVHNSNFNLWYRGQLTVLLSLTNYRTNSMFIGPKNDTLKALTILILSRI